MKKFKLALLGLAVVTMTALSSCGGGMSDAEAEAAANDILNELNASLDSAMDAVEEPVTEVEEAVTEGEEAVTEGEEAVTEGEEAVEEVVEGE